MRLFATWRSREMRLHLAALCLLASLVCSGCDEGPLDPDPAAGLIATDSLGVQLLAAQRVRTLRWANALQSIVYEAEITSVPSCSYCPSSTWVVLRLTNPIDGVESNLSLTVSQSTWRLSSTGAECFVNYENRLRRYDLMQPGAVGVDEGRRPGSVLSRGDSLVAWFEPGSSFGYGLPHPDDRVFVRRRGSAGPSLEAGRGSPIEFSPDARQLIVQRTRSPDGLSRSFWLVDLETLVSTELPNLAAESWRLPIDWNGASPLFYLSKAMPSRIVEYEPLTGAQNTVVEFPFAAADGIRAMNDPLETGPMAFTAYRWAGTHRRSAIWMWDPATRRAQEIVEGIFDVGGGDFLPDRATFAAAIDRKLYLLPLPVGP